MSGNYCKICRSNTFETIFKPRDEKVREQWSRSTGVEFAKTSAVCYKHFKDSDIYINSKNQRRLMPNALPQLEVRPVFTEHLSSACGNNVFDFSSQTEQEVIDSGLALENIRLQREVADLKRKNAKLLDQIVKTQSVRDYAELCSDNEDDNQSDDAGAGKQRFRNVLTLEERVAVIQQFAIVPIYSKIARSFNCGLKQIKSVVSNRKAILEFNEAVNLLSNHANEDSEERLRKLNFLAHCLYEYIQRAQFHLNNHVNDEQICKWATEFLNLLQIDGFTPNQTWINQFKAAFSIDLSDTKIKVTRRPPKSMDLRDIMTYCGRHTPIVLLRPTAKTKQVPQVPQDEVEVRRNRKILFLEKCLHEYVQRSQVHHKGRLHMDNLRFVAITLRDILHIDSFIPDKTWFDHFKSEYNFTPSVGVPIVTNSRVAVSLDLHDIVSYCSRSNIRPRMSHKKKVDAMIKNAKKKRKVALEPKDKDHDDDCVAVETPTELIEISNEDEDDRNESTGIPIRQEFDDNSSHSSLKIEKLDHSPLHINDYHPVDVEMPEMAPAPSTGHHSEASDEAQLPSCVESYKDALRLLKPLEDFTLMGENYRAIGLLSQLEKIFETGIKTAEMGSSPE